MIWRCVQNPVEEMRKLAEFLGVPACDEFIADVNKAASIENMRENVGKTSESAHVSRNQLKDGSYVGYSKSP